jgi:hypothetical protein
MYSNITMAQHYHGLIFSGLDISLVQYFYGSIFIRLVFLGLDFLCPSASIRGGCSNPASLGAANTAAKP